MAYYGIHTALPSAGYSNYGGYTSMGGYSAMGARRHRTRRGGAEEGNVIYKTGRDGVVRKMKWSAKHNKYLFAKEGSGARRHVVHHRRGGEGTGRRRYVHYHRRGGEGEGRRVHHRRTRGGEGEGRRVHHRRHTGRGLLSFLGL